MAVGVSVGKDVSVGRIVSVGILMGASVDGIASGAGEEQDTRKKKIDERRMRVTACLCMDGF